MRAITVSRFGGPEVLALEELPDPAPGPGEVLVRVRHAGVNPVDTYIRAGSYARLPDLPYVPGWDGAGVVEAAGEGATFRPGDPVYFCGTARGRSEGAYAELAVCRPHQVFPLPPSLSTAQGAAIGVPYATAHRALFHRARAQAGETVLVHGASGAVGLAAVQLARAHGLTVIGTAGTEKGLQLVRDNGAHHAVSHRDPAEGEQIRALTGGRGPGLIIEMLANVNLDRDLGLLALRGRVVIIGSRGRIEIDPRQTMSKDLSVLGMTLWNTSDEELAGIHQALGPGLADGTLRPVVGREFPLAEARAALEAVIAGPASGKIVLRVG